jgi:hypothetical protein
MAAPPLPDSSPPLSLRVNFRHRELLAELLLMTLAVQKRAGRCDFRGMIPARFAEGSDEALC